MRNRCRTLATVTALLLASTACGDRTVTSQPAESNVPAAVTDSAGGAAADEADLQEIDALLRDIEADLASIDQDRATPEGDPTQ